MWINIDGRLWNMDNILSVRVNEGDSRSSIDITENFAPDEFGTIQEIFDHHDIDVVRDVFEKIQDAMSGHIIYINTRPTSDPLPSESQEKFELPPVNLMRDER